MDSSLFFIIVALVLVVALHFIVFKTPSNIIAFWKNKNNKGAHHGIIVFVLVAVVIGIFSFASNNAKGEEITQMDLSSPAKQYVIETKEEKTLSESFEWFAFGELYFGADYTAGTSPQCWDGAYSDRWTSHGGLRANIVQTTDKRVALNAKYTHHSCAFNDDKDTYDAAGVELTLKLW